jgi:uncharacterized protein YidB (DUF937 family)
MLGGILGNATGQSMGTPAPAQGGGMSPVLTALLPIVLNMLMNRQGGGSSGGLGNILGGMFGGGGAGGLGGLLEQFQRAGFAEQANSWVGRGQNQPITPDAIGQVLGSEAVSKIAQQAGITEAEASHGISQLLPELVDRLTPDGSVPGLDQLSASVDDLARRFGG